jgi:hypothetical protein
MPDLHPFEIRPTHSNGVLHWVIIGGGPAGLLTALLLGKKNIGKITLVEPRLGEYVRSGDYVNDVFVELSKALDVSLNEILPSYANHIKDVERLLYERVKASSTIMIRGKFITYSIKGAHIEINDNSAEEHIIPCNLLIDCSGQNLSVLNQVNELHQSKPIFSRAKVGQVPHTRHIHATIIMDRSKGDRCRQKLPIDDHLIKMRRKTALKNLGWDRWSNPFGYINGFGMFGLVSSKKMQLPQSKYHFYSEIPTCLEEKNIIPWIKAYMAATSGMSMDYINVELTHASKKYHGKKRQWDIFDVVPQATSPFHYVDYNRNSIVLLHLGDASFNNIFYFGQGLIRTIQQASTFIKAIQVTNDGIVAIDFDTFKRWSEENLQSYIDRVPSTINKLHGAIEEREQSQLKASFDLYKIGESYLQIFPNDGRNPYITMGHNIIKLIEPMLDEHFEALVMAWKWAPNNQSKPNLKHSLFLMAKHCEQFADFIKNKGDNPYYYKKSVKYYNKSLELHLNYLPPVFAHEKEMLRKHIGLISQKLTELRTRLVGSQRINTNLLSDRDPNLDQKNEHGESALFRAAQNGDIETVKWLIEHGASFKDPRNDGISPLHISAYNGHSKVIELLLDFGDECNKAEPVDGGTALYMAAQNGHFEAVKHLLAHKAKINKTVHSGTTALYIAIQNDHDEVINLLLRLGADVNKNSINGPNPIMLAVCLEKTKIVRLLLEAGVNIYKACRINEEKPILNALSFYSDIKDMELANLLEPHAFINQIKKTNYNQLAIIKLKSIHPALPAIHESISNYKELSTCAEGFIAVMMSKGREPSLDTGDEPLLEYLFQNIQYYFNEFALSENNQKEKELIKNFQIYVHDILSDSPSKKNSQSNVAIQGLFKHAATTGPAKLLSGSIARWPFNGIDGMPNAELRSNSVGY